MKYELDVSNCGGIMRKILYIMIGCISLGLGIIGVILPILPTVPFVLLAAFCFARSSERLDGYVFSNFINEYWIYHDGIEGHCSW